MSEMSQAIRQPLSGREMLERCGQWVNPSTGTLLPGGVPVARIGSVDRSQRLSSKPGLP